MLLALLLQVLQPLLKLVLFLQSAQLLPLLFQLLAGLLVLGIFSRRASAAGALVGALASVVMLLYVNVATDVSGLMNACIAVASCVGTGWLASLLLPPHGRSLQGLTLWTSRPRAADP